MKREYQDENRVESLAKMLAAAYWRGRLEDLRRTNFEDGTFEKMIEAAAENDLHRWKTAALLALAEE